jgi:hypothetical protein
MGMSRVSRFERVMVAIVACTAALVSGEASFAIDWERMVMPGPLAADHEEFAKDCASCHQAFDAGAQRSLCLACHEEIAEDLNGGLGFHSRSRLAATGQCNSCHPDHKGRDANILGLSNATFDHALTDYPLKGRHSAVTCAECHRPEIPRRDAPGECKDCHLDDDAHGGALSDDCGQCHDEMDWRKTRFDHDSTEYPLTGGHVTASCDGCHVTTEYKETPTNCVSCHAIDDAHEGNFGLGCADCHKTDAWRKESFDHKKESGFALTGAHGEARCATCHRLPPGERKLPETCSGCHSSDDVHAGRFGETCGTCHSPSTWDRSKFDHAKQTKFPLRGAHRQSSCNACHTEQVKEGETPMDCYECHRSDDVHQGNLGKKCADCHNAESFSGRVLFDHELAGFPLLGLHAVAACESCHRDHTFSIDDVSCLSCHKQDDAHEQTLGSDCQGCHNPNGWMRWQFEHDTETSFALHGAHADLACSGCHRTVMTGRTQVAGDCIDCHAAEDAHRGGFGRSCDDCHTDEAWKPATFGRRRGLK